MNNITNHPIIIRTEGYQENIEEKDVPHCMCTPCIEVRGIEVRASKKIQKRGPGIGPLAILGETTLRKLPPFLLVQIASQLKEKRFFQFQIHL